MGCFTLGWLQQVLIWLVIVGAIYALITLLIPFVANIFGSAGATIAAALRIVLWAVVAIIVIMVIFTLIGCLLGMSGGLHFPIR